MQSDQNFNYFLSKNISLQDLLPSQKKEKKLYGNYSQDRINKNVVVHGFFSTFMLCSSIRQNKPNGQVF